MAQLSAAASIRNHYRAQCEKNIQDRAGFELRPHVLRGCEARLLTSWLRAASKYFLTLLVMNHLDFFFSRQIAVYWARNNF